MIRFHLGRKINFKPGNCRMYFYGECGVHKFNFNIFHLQSSVCHIFPSVLSWHGCSDVYSVRMVQRFIYHEFCCCDSTVVRRFLDSKEYYRPLAGRTAMVELHWWQWRIALGVWIEKGTTWRLISTTFHSQHSTNHCLYVFVCLFVWCNATHYTNHSFHTFSTESCSLLILTTTLHLLLCNVQCYVFCVAIFNSAGSC